MRRLLFISLILFFPFMIQAKTNKVLVAYFSCTGTTEKVAKSMANAVNAKLYCITPKQKYTAADLDWRDKNCRSNKEMADSTSRPELLDKNADIESYNIIFVGYPIWWNICPRAINSFIESYNFKGKIVIPFATSGGSAIRASVNYLKGLYPDINWKEGKLLSNTEQAAEWARSEVLLY